jgi:RHS repeat-associated protein
MGALKLSFNANTSLTRHNEYGFLSIVAKNGVTIRKSSNYSPGGMKMPGTQFYANNKPRYTFNGKEEDPENGGRQDYGMRIYDPNIIKFLSVDPLFKGFAWYTPYQFAGNKPIVAIDLDGLEEYIVHNIYNKKTGELKSISVASFRDVAGKVQENNIHKDGKDVTTQKVMTTYSYDDGTPMSDPTFQDELTKTQKEIESENMKVTKVGPTPKTSKFKFDGYEGDPFDDGTFSVSKRVFEPTPTFAGKKVESGAKFMRGGIPAYLGVADFPQAGNVNDITGDIKGLSNAIKKAGGISEVNVTLTGRPGTSLTADQLNEYTNQLNEAAGNIQKEYQKHLGKGVKVNVNTVVEPSETEGSQTTIKLK